MNWVPAHWWFLVAVGVLAVLAGGGWLHQRQRRRGGKRFARRACGMGWPSWTHLHHTRFEDAIRDLMLRDGCQDATRVGGRGTRVLK